MTMVDFYILIIILVVQSFLVDK